MKTKSPSSPHRKTGHSFRKKTRSRIASYKTPEHLARRCPKAPNHGHGRSTFEVTFLKIRTWLERTVFWCGGGSFFWHLGDAILDLVFFESESNVRHRPCPWFGAFGHLLAGCSGVFSSNQKATLDTGHVHGSGWGRVGARFLASWGCHFWTLFSSNQKATLDTGHLHGSGPSGTSWQGVLVWWGRVFWHLGDAISGPCFLRIRKQR